MTDYPERRPYTTTVPHSGYRSRPQTLFPRPPKEALLVLSSHEGYDAPHNTRVLTHGARLPSLKPRSPKKGSSPAASIEVDPALLPNNNRTSKEALSGAKLEDPFQHDSSSYHTSQQAALNAQLRRKVEKLVESWNDKMDQLREVIDHYPTEGAITNYNTTQALKAYNEVYRCTENLVVAAQTVVEDFKLTVPLKDLDDIEAVPVLPLDNIRRSLDSLLNSKYLLAPLDQYIASLEAFDRITKPLSDQTAGEEMDADAVLIGPVIPSTTAVALHERFHYRPGEYAEKELKKTDDAIKKMEARVLLAKKRKEEAIDNLDPIEALRNLHAQVDFSNDLLLMNRARMQLVNMHGDDVRDMREAVTRLIEDANRAVEMIHARVQDLLSRITQDTQTMTDEVYKSRSHIADLEQKEKDACEAMRKELQEMDDTEKELWDLLQATMNKLVESAENKVKGARRYMSQREKRSKEYTMASELLAAQESQLARLGQCEEFVRRWDQGGEIYQRYVDAFTPKLLKRMNQIEEEDEDLYNREAQEYVRRYEMFEYGVEEARAKRVVQADRMRLLQRSTMLDQERVVETLDPTSEMLTQRLSDAQRELEEVQAYVEYLDCIEQDRRSEVEPVLQRVIVFNITMHTQGSQSGEDGTGAPRRLAQRSPAESEATAVEQEVADGAAAGDLVSAERDGGSVLMATVAHPHVTARILGLGHEEAHNEKHRHLADEELASVEEMLGRIRKSKAELANMSLKNDPANRPKTGPAPRSTNV